MSRCIAVSCAALLLFCGCGGPEGPEMVDISGTVTYQGEPIQDGAIRFVPAQGEQNRVTPVQIKNGAYEASGDRGLAVGNYKVEFHAYEEDTAAAADPAQEGGVIPGMEVKKELLPEKYHKESTETLTVESGSGSITKDYNLE